MPARPPRVASGLRFANRPMRLSHWARWNSAARAASSCSRRRRLATHSSNHAFRGPTGSVGEAGPASAEAGSAGEAGSASAEAGSAGEARSACVEGEEHLTAEAGSARGATAWPRAAAGGMKEALPRPPPPVARGSCLQSSESHSSSEDIVGQIHFLSSLKKVRQATHGPAQRLGHGNSMATAWQQHGRSLLPLAHLFRILRLKHGPLEEAEPGLEARSSLTRSEVG